MAYKKVGSSLFRCFISGSGSKCVSLQSIKSMASCSRGWLFTCSEWKTSQNQVRTGARLETEMSSASLVDGRSVTLVD